MIDITQDIQPLTTFRNNSAEFIQQLKDTKRPIILTVNGKPEAVLQDPAEYPRLLNIAAEADAEEGLRQGLADIAAGRTRPAREVFAELREEYGIRG